MTLPEFLEKNKKAILALAEKKTIELAALRPSSDELQKGLPLFYDQLISVLIKGKHNVSLVDENAILGVSGAHGKELLRLGYTLSHVVHAYGAICQAITGIASETKAPVTSLEFHNLNRCLDIAIAGAVTEFESVRNIETKSREVEHLGALAHELRNALNRASIASEMMSKGIVGAAGSTARVLQYSLTEMQTLLDRSLAEIKLRAGSEIHEEVMHVIELVNQLLITAEIEAGIKGQTITVKVDTRLEIKTDRLLILSALGNIIQNAIKYTKANGSIKIVALPAADKVIIEIMDECGGIAPAKIEEMFKPFSQISTDKSGLGLGVNIARRAIESCGGQLSVHNIPDGCAFKIILPKLSSASFPSSSAV